MNRRDFLRTSLAGAVAGPAIFLSGNLLADSKPVIPARPNIVFVLSDDHSFPFLGCYGYPVKTPNLDRFAAQGMRFDSAFVGAPQCVPSRAVLMTGFSPVQARMARFSSPLPPDIPALPDLLRQKGYFTGVCRRYYHLDGPIGKREDLKPYQNFLDEKNLRQFRDRLDFVEISDHSTLRHRTPVVMKEFLEKVPEGKPFFMWVNFNDPHFPWDENAIPQPHDPDDMVVPGYLPDLPSVRKALALHCDEIARLDEEFKWLMDVLDAHKLWDNTVVIFMGDNGLAVPHGKGSLYDSGLRVPLLVRWPGTIKPGSSTKVMVDGQDFAPMILEIAGIKPTQEMKGISYLDLLKGKEFSGRKYVFGERNTHGDAPTRKPGIRSSDLDYSRCVRSERYKLIYNCTPDIPYRPVDSYDMEYWKEMESLFEQGKLDKKFVGQYFTTPRPVWELYDLKTDPDELNNRIDDPGCKTVIKELKQALMENMTLNYDFLPLGMP